MRTLIGQATREVILVGYAVHDGRKIFEPLARRMEEIPGLAVTICLDIQRAWNDPTPSADLVARFGRDFRTKHWPRPTLPALYYAPRSLETGDARASVHAKCVIIDRTRAPRHERQLHRRRPTQERRSGRGHSLPTLSRSARRLLPRPLQLRHVRSLRIARLSIRDAFTPGRQDLNLRPLGWGSSHPQCMSHFNRTASPRPRLASHLHARRHP